MISDAHSRAESFAAEAESFLSLGRTDEAVSLYAKAARYEVEALREINPEKRRTFSALSLSAVALLYKARQYQDVENIGYSCLAQHAIESYARTEIREIIDAALDEARLSHEGLRYNTRAIDVVLLGGSVGFGTAGLGPVLDQMTTHFAITRRVAEWKLGLPLRMAGAPPSRVDEMINARVTQPMFGSYRFSIKLAEPEPSLLPESDSVSRSQADEIARETFNIIRSSINGDLPDLQAMQLPEGYLRALVRLVRNLAPDGKNIEQVTIRQQAATLPRNTVHIRRESRLRLNTLLSKIDPAPEPDTVEFRGILRALDLDKSLIEIVNNHGRVKLSGKEAALDDVVGPMVNKAVIARAITKKRQPYKLVDVDLENNS